MAKSLKQQMYEQLANQHVQQALNNIGMQQFQEAYNQWNAEQEGLANFEAQYNEWAKANPVEVAQPTPQPKIPVLNTPDMTDFFKPKTASGIDVNQQAAKEMNRRAFNEAYARQQQEEQALASRREEKREVLPAVTGDTVGSAVNQLDLSQYNLKNDAETKRDIDEALRIQEDYEKAKRWVDPSYKMTKEEEAEARGIAERGRTRLEKVVPSDGQTVYFMGRSEKDMTPEEQREYNVYKDLALKTNDVASIAVNAGNAIYRAGKTIGDWAVSGTAKGTKTDLKLYNKLLEALGKKTLTDEEIAQVDNVPEKYKAAVRELDKQFAPTIQNANIQNPIASGVGSFAGNALMYIPTSAGIGAITGSLGLGAGASFAANQALQIGQDELLDVQPLIRELRDMGYSDEDINKIANKRRAFNTGINLGMGIIPKIPGAIKGAIGDVQANKAADAAFRANATEGAERLAKLANGEDIVDAAKVATPAQDIPTVDEIASLIRRTTDQAETAARNIDELSKKIPSPEEILELEREANTMDEIDDLTNIFKRETPKAEAPQIEALEPPKAPKVETPEAPKVEAPEAPKYNYDGGVDNPELTFNQNEKINSAILYLEGPFNDADVTRAVGSEYNKIQSEVGNKLYWDYENALEAAYKADTPEAAQAFKDQAKEIRSSLKNIDKSEQQSIKQLMDYWDTYYALQDYKKALNGTDREAVDTAKKAVDAARNRLARGKGKNPVLQEAFSSNYGKVVGNAANDYGYAQTDNMDLIQDWIEQDAKNTNKYVRDANVPAQVVEDAAKSQQIDPSKVKINELPSKKGPRYQVVYEDGNLTTPLEPGKTYKTIEQANEAAYEIKNSQVVENEVSELGTGNRKMNLMTFNDENAVRHGVETSDDLWNELKAGENGVEPSAPIAPEDAPIPQGKKLSRLYNTLQNTDKLTDAEKETFKNKNGFIYDPEVEKELGAAALEEVENGGAENIYREYMDGAIDGPLTGKDTHRMFAASADYNRMAREALEEGNEGAAAIYAAKARNIMLEARYHATSGGQFNAAIAYYARTPQGYVDKAYDVLAKQLQEFSGKNPKLASDIDKMAEALSGKLKDVDIDGIMSGSDEAAKQNLRSIVLNTIDSVAKKGSKQAKNIFKDLSPEELDNIINSKYEADLARNLDMFAMGSYGVRPATVDKVMDIFADAEKYNINSKEYGKLEKQAFDLLMNDLNGGRGKSFADKFDTWRYLSMLFNPLTWMKNTTGNFTNWGLTGLKNNLAAAIEESAEHRAIAKGADGIFGGRTKAILTPNDSGLIESCAKDFDDFSYRAYKNGGNRWINFERDLEHAGDVFNNKRPLGKLLNKANAFNNDVMLGGMDTVAGKAKYKTSMAGFLKANGADDSIFKSTDPEDLKLLAEAREYALDSANEATFHTTRGLSSAISGWIRAGKESSDPAYKVAARMLDFTVPFIKTPGNILRACVDYSPAKFLQVIAETGQWQKGTISTAKYIDDISKALTGTGLMVIGAALGEMGLLNVNTGDSDLDTFNKKKGLTNASIPTLGGRRLSISSLAPTAMPLIWGAQAWSAIKGEGESKGALDTFYNGISTMGDTLTDMTMLAGISDMIESIRYSGSKGEAVTKVATQAGTNLTSQLLPTLGRKIEQTVDDTARSTYSGQESNMLRTLDSNRKYLTSKVPFSQEFGELLEGTNNQTIQGIGDFITNEPSVNGWGEEVKNQDYGIGLPGRLVHNTLDIFNTNDVNATERDNYLKDIYQKGGREPKVLQFGYVTQSDAKIDNYRMTEKEWTQYQKDSGVIRGELLDAAMSNEELMGQKKADQATTITSLKDFAKKYTQYKVCGEKAEMELPSIDQELMEIYDKAGGGEAGAKAVVDNVMIRDVLGAAGYSYKEGSAATEAVQNMTAEEREEFIETSNTLTDYGLTSYSSQATWDKVQKVMPGTTIDQFAKTYNDIDSMGKKNQAIAQGELIDYLNKYNVSRSEGTKIWNGYGSAGWKYIPVLENGVWSKKHK